MEFQMKRILFAVIATIFCAMPGCTPRVRVTPHPGPHEQGIRYYRPKPYLLITAAAKEVETDNGKTITRIPGEQFVNIQLQYLPDFEEEYAIDVRTGLGTADVEIKLENGWNLTGLNQDLDSKTSENIEAAASLMSAIAKTGAKSMVDDGGRNNPPSFEVKASNVPLGYYESILGKDSCGRKKLYGFRYVGFMPYQTCPTIMNGVECANCQSTDLYGIVFVNGTMMFRPLAEVQQLTASNAAVHEPSEVSH